MVCVIAIIIFFKFYKGSTKIKEDGDSYNNKNISSRPENVIEEDEDSLQLDLKDVFFLNSDDIILDNLPGRLNHRDDVSDLDILTSDDSASRVSFSMLNNDLKNMTKVFNMIQQNINDIGEKKTIL